MSNTLDSSGTHAQTAILVADDLRKSYAGRPALRGLSFSLRRGRVLGFLGPNGAGKTTAIRILTTILQPTSGHFFVAGVSSEFPERVRRKIGVLPESLGFPRQMTGVELLTYYGRLYGRSAKEARSLGMALLDAVGLASRAKSLIGTYSRGMRQRLGIARALINDPDVVFLDEPTLGLDPRGQQELLALIRGIATDRNAGVILCSHFLAEIEGFCDDVVILSQGQVVAKGSVGDVIGGAQQAVVQRNVVRVHVPAPSTGEAQRLLEAIPIVMRVVPAGDPADRLRVELTEEAVSQNHDGKNVILDALIRAHIPVLRFEAEGTRLQDVFLQLTNTEIQ